MVRYSNTPGIRAINPGHRNGLSFSEQMMATGMQAMKPPPDIIMISPVIFRMDLILILVITGL